ncbi:MAG TPA: SgcJ/EcaC family oxidoreductase [Myxococcota bacterium]|nr:SgcJ/EcaC family oxidoreductase [Myxococcota bacterium]
MSPEDWPRLFTERLNAGDLDGVVALYAPNARFVTQSGETLSGLERIREVLAELIDARAKLESRVVHSVVVDDVALLYTDFRGTTPPSAGAAVELRQRALEVLRRQPDGRWKLIVGDPGGRDRAGAAR